MAKKFPYEPYPSVAGALERMGALFDDSRLRQLVDQALAFQNQFQQLADLRAHAGLSIDPSIIKAAEGLHDLGRTALGRFADLDPSRLRALAGAVDPMAHLLPERAALGFDADKWQTMMPALIEVQGSIARSIALARHAGGTLAGFDHSHLGGIIGIEDKQRSLLAAGLTGITRSFEDLYQDLKSKEDLLSIPRYVIDRPPQEVFVHSRVLEVISVRPQETKTEPGIVDKYEDLKREAESSLHGCLDSLGRQFVQMWRGARQALASRNPDRVRQASASMRELVTQVLHTLASDGDVKSWSSSPEHFDEKGRPTRKARLLYVVRQVNRDRFSRFVQSDLDAALQLLELLQKGVHAPDSGFTEDQVSVLTLRVDHLLMFLLEMGSPKGNS